MAKKVVAGLRKAKDQVKLIRAVKSSKTGHYTFQEQMVPKDQINDVLKKQA
jgi:hypothetical protein